MNPESRTSGSGPSDHPGMTATPSLQRLVDFDLEHDVDIGCRHRADHLVDNGALAADDEGLRHAVNPPFDPGAAVAVDTDNSVRVAVTAEKAARLVRSVLVIDADQLQPLVLAQLDQKRRFVVARYAPGRPDIDDADLAHEHRGIEPGHRCAAAGEALQRR